MPVNSIATFILIGGSGEFGLRNTVEIIRPELVYIQTVGVFYLGLTMPMA